MEHVAYLGGHSVRRVLFHSLAGDIHDVLGEITERLVQHVVRIKRKLDCLVGYDIEVPLGDKRLAYRGRVPAFTRVFPAHAVNNEILGLARRIVVLPLVFPFNARAIRGILVYGLVNPVRIDVLHLRLGFPVRWRNQNESRGLVSRGRLE